MSASEIDVLKDLHSSFGRQKPINFDEALQLISLRNRAIEKEIPVLVTFIRNLSKTTPLGTYFLTIGTGVHRLIFDGIYSNNGKYRKHSDPNGGVVYFGGLEHNEHRAKFQGTVPFEIETELEKISRWLTIGDPDPIYTGLNFFRHYLYIHPFYDANGRIARMLVSIYLRLYNYDINWKKIQNNKKYIKRLTECHKRHNTDEYSKYFKFLLKSFKKQIFKIENFDEFPY